MGMEKCGKFMKWSLFGFNFLILISGCVLLGIGIYTRISQSGLTQISAILGNQLYSTFSIVLIIIGCVIIVISFFGCCGAIKEVRCMLGAFFVLLLIIFTTLLVGGCVAYAFRTDLGNYMKGQMYSSLNVSYGTNGQEPITDAWDSIQQLFKCCGVEGRENSSTSWAYYKYRSAWFLQQQPGLRQFVPKSCCKGASEDIIKKCTGRKSNKVPPAAGPPVWFNRRNKNLYTKGCFTAIVDFIWDNSTIIISILVTLGVIIILGMIFSICLCRAIRDEYELSETYCPP